MQHFVADGMPSRIVDFLEAVEIEVKQSDAAAIGVTGGCLFLQHFVEIAPVGETRQRIVQGVMLNARRCRDQCGIARFGQCIGAL